MCVISGTRPFETYRLRREHDALGRHVVRHRRRRHVRRGALRAALQQVEVAGRREANSMSTGVPSRSRSTRSSARISGDERRVAQQSVERDDEPARVGSQSNGAGRWMPLCVRRRDTIWRTPGILRARLAQQVRDRDRLELRRVSRLIDVDLLAASSARSRRA